MNYFGVPILDWILLMVLIGLGIEAYITTRTPKDQTPEKSSSEESPEAHSK